MAGRGVGRGVGQSVEVGRWAAGLVSAVVVVGGLVLGPPAFAAPDPGLYPDVVDVPAVVTATYSGPTAASSYQNYIGSGSPTPGTFISLPMGDTSPGQAKVVHGRVVNDTAYDQCLFLTRGNPNPTTRVLVADQGTSTAQGTANVMLLETTGLPIPAGALGSSGVPGNAGPLSNNVISASTSDWECTAGALVAPGGTFEFTVTAGIPLGGTGLSGTSSPRVRVYLQAARHFDQSWDDIDYCSFTNPASCTTDNPTRLSTIPEVILASSTTHDSAGSIPLIQPTDAYGSTGIITNDLDYPITASYAGYHDEGDFAPYLTGTLRDWAGDVVLAPGESSDPFIMWVGSPRWIGNESRPTSGARISFSWNISPLLAAVDDTASTTAGTPVDIDVLGNDIAPPDAGITVAGDANGTWEVLAGQVRFTPAPGFAGDATAQYTITADGASSTATITVTVAPPPAARTVVFDANGGTGTMSPQSATQPAPLSPSALTRDGHTFLHWNTAPDGTGTSYADGQTYDFAADLTLYATWDPIPTDIGDSGDSGDDGDSGDGGGKAPRPGPDSGDNDAVPGPGGDTQNGGSAPDNRSSPASSGFGLASTGGRFVRPALISATGALLAGTVLLLLRARRRA